MRKLFALVAILSLTACQNVPIPQNPQQSVLALEGTYGAALSSEVTYSHLPKCATGAPLLCSKPSIVRKVRAASDTAWAAIKAAQDAVRSDGYGSDLATTTYATASAALKAYTDITVTLKTK